MKKYVGLSGSKGISIGKLNKKQLCIQPKSKGAGSANVETELNMLNKARKIASNQLEKLKYKAEQNQAQEEADIWKVHQMMLNDKDYWDCIESTIVQNETSATEGVKKAAETFTKLLMSSGSQVIKERSADVKDISLRLIACLNDSNFTLCNNSTAEPEIILVEELLPSDIMMAEKEKVLGFVASKGSVTEHACILARAAGIPVVVGAGIDLLIEKSGQTVILDGDRGLLIVEPDEPIIEHYDTLIKRKKEENALLQELKTQKSVTQDGKEIHIFCNISSEKEAKIALNNGAEGIGLFRSEFLFLHRSEPLMEEEQYKIYSNIAEMFGSRRVIVRTLDIGSDKQADYIDLGSETNPALGNRGIRYLLEEPHLLEIQLRALCRASIHGNLAIMFPMITTADEVIQLKQIFQNVYDGLKSNGVAVADRIELGIMIETPAAAMISDRLSKLVDFFSIGTNDLTQYTLAIDRTNEKVSHLYDVKNPAVMRLIVMTAKNGKESGISVGICGESASDPDLAAAFAAIGIDELSVTPGEVLPLRKIICSLTEKMQADAIKQYC